MQSYDEQVLPEIDVKQQGMLPLELDEALEAIADLMQALIKKKEATELFGQIRGAGLASALSAIEQGLGMNCSVRILPVGMLTCFISL